MKMFCVLAGGALFALSSFGLADVSSVVCTSRQPWDGKVDVAVTLANAEADQEYTVSLTLVLPDGTEKPIGSLSEPLVKGNGKHVIVWDAAAYYPNQRLSGVAVKATVAPYDASKGLYLVFDLSGGSNAASYPHYYTTVAPDPASDICRTTELWMRRVPGETYTRGNISGGAGGRNSLPPHQVTLSKSYYLGVFEMTQRQYELITGNRPSYFTTKWEMRPVETVSFVDFRESHSGWYDANAIPATSPLGKIRARTGFAAIDYPTEAQWERAYRAGTSLKYWSADVTDANVKNYSRNSEQKQASTVKSGEVDPDVGGTQIVGTFPPNGWGFYDMAGNVSEICGDGNPYTSDALIPSAEVFAADFAAAPYVDIRGPTPEWKTRTGATTTDYTSSCTTRGGSWQHSSGATTAAWRDGVGRGNGRISAIGMRLCLTCNE